MPFMRDERVRECMDSLALLTWELKLALDELDATGKISRSVKERLDEYLNRVLNTCRIYGK